jgi:hypothetical protein
MESLGELIKSQMDKRIERLESARLQLAEAALLVGVLEALIQADKELPVTHSSVRVDIEEWARYRGLPLTSHESSTSIAQTREELAQAIEHSDIQEVTTGAKIRVGHSHVEDTVILNVNRF